MFRPERKVTDSVEAYLADAGEGLVSIVIAKAVVEATKLEIQVHATRLMKSIEHGGGSRREMHGDEARLLKGSYS